MKLSKKTIGIALVAFMVTAIASFAPPIAAQTASAELLQVKAKWRHLDLSENPWQILYARVKNNGTEPVYVQVRFVIRNGDEIATYFTEEFFLPVQSRPLLLQVTIGVELPGAYYVEGALFYREEGGEWITDGVIRAARPSFIAVP